MYKIFIFLSVLIYSFLGIVLMAQKNLNFIEGQFAGSFKVQISGESGAEVNYLGGNSVTVVTAPGGVLVFRMYSIEKLVEGELEHSKDINNRFLNRYKIVFPSSCQRSKDGSILVRQGSDSPELEKQKNGFRIAEIRYKINGYGQSTVDFGYAVINKGDNTSECEFMTDFNITVKAPVKPLDEQFEELQRGGFRKLCEYLTDEPLGELSLRANEAINKLAEADWNAAKDQIAKTSDRNERLKICNRFIESYNVCRNLNLRTLDVANALRKYLEDQLKKPNPNPDPSPTPMDPDIKNEKELWNKTQNSHQVKLYREFLTQFPTGKFAALANDSILRLTPIGISAPEEAKNDSIILKFSNLVDPMFYSHGLDVKFKINDNTLILTFQKPNGRFVIEVFDEKYPWKKVSQNVDNLFVPTMTLDKDQFEVKFEGGVRPYKIEIIDPVSLITLYSKTGITGFSQIVTFKELKEKNLLGKFKVRAADGSIPSIAIELHEISIPENSLWWVFVLGFFIFSGIAGIIYYMSKLSKKKNANIFNT